VTGLVVKGYPHLVVASTSGETALLMARTLQETDSNVVDVIRNVGSVDPNQDECGQDLCRELASLGVRIYTSTNLTRGIESALMKKHQGIMYPTYVVAQILKAP
jgi:hypothetical protein